MTILIIAIIIAAIVAVVVLKNKKGGGNSHPVDPGTPPAEPRKDIIYCYFGGNADQLRETIDHCKCTMIPDWGPWDDATRPAIADRMLSEMQTAVDLGFTQLVIAISMFVYRIEPSTTGRLEDYKFRGVDELVAFKARCDAAGLTDKVIMLYPVDEPNLHNLSDADVVAANSAIRAVWPGPKLGCIYGGDHDERPGLGSYEWVGVDNYGAKEGVLGMLPSIRPDQRWIIVPGGWEGTMQDPEPFYQFANNHPEVAVIMPFLWIDGESKGIRSNSLHDAYVSVGKRCTGKA